MRLKTQPRAPRGDDGGPPWPLSDGPTVEHFAPDYWHDSHGIEPDHSDPDWWAALMQARRSHREYHFRWAGDVGLGDDEAERTMVHRRPRW